jgi:hypothetical protein
MPARTTPCTQQEPEKKSSTTGLLGDKQQVSATHAAFKIPATGCYQQHHLIPFTLLTMAERNSANAASPCTRKRCK